MRHKLEECTEKENKNMKTLGCKMQRLWPGGKKKSTLVTSESSRVDSLPFVESFSQLKVFFYNCVVIRTGKKFHRKKKSLR